MGRFEVYRSGIKGQTPYLLDVQAEALSDLGSCVVIPFIPAAQKRERIPQLHLVFMIEELEHVLVTDFIGAIERRHLGRRVTSLADRHFEIVPAIDFLLQGF